MKTLLVLLFLAVLANAQRPQPCRTPPVWKARQMSIDPSKDATVFAKFYYDSFNERLRVIEDVDVHKKQSFYDIFFIYSEESMYVVEFSINNTIKCSKEDLKDEFHKFEVPENATELGVFTIGSNALSQTGLNVVTFGGELEGVRYLVTVSEEGCLPVHEVLYMEGNQIIYSSYFDIEFGVNPEDFVPPKECYP